jgi:hypothetical protein
MTAAKIAPYNFGRLKKKVKKVVGRLFPPPSNVPGQVDYPAIPEVRKAEIRRKKLLDKMER